MGAKAAPQCPSNALIAAAFAGCLPTRSDKTKESYLGFVSLASIKLWIPFVHDA